MSDTPHDTDIAIVGMAGRFPGAPDVDTFWQNLRSGVEAISTFTEEELRAAGVDEAALAHPRYVRARGVVEGAEEFDAAFFGYSPREAEIMDPQHRLFLECAWQAMESAGYASEDQAGPVGVFGSVGINSYMLNNLLSRPDVMRSVGGMRAGIGSDKDYLTTRVSYKLELTGPSFAVQTACSSSLVAVHLACQSLLAFECDTALAGGVAIAVPQRAGYWTEEGGIASPSGHCRAFAESSDGTVFGDGVGIVVLRRAVDAVEAGDHVLALVRGTAINNDGGARIGYTAPSARGQSRVITEALAAAGVEPSTITLVEAHGTGTEMGDPIEVSALAEAYAVGGAAPSAGSCAIGSVKSNVGHLAEAAGVVGLMKAALALHHGEIPPSLHCRRPNPRIDFAATPFRLAAELEPWRPPAGTPRRAAVSSFGIGGTNAHAVLEEAPPRIEDPTGEAPRPWQLAVISARTESARRRAADNLAAHLADRSELALADVAHTLRVGRRALPHRLAVVARTAEDARAALEDESSLRRRAATAPDGRRPVAFLLPGQGAQRPGMLRHLSGEPEVVETVAWAAERLRPTLGVDLAALLLDDPADHPADALDATALTQPALFVAELALAWLWRFWGVEPEALLGHSIGEWVAATLAGVMPPDVALDLVAERGRLMQQQPAGAMVAVRLSADEAEVYLGDGVSLAAVNGPRAVTLSGPSVALGALEGRLAADGVRHRRLDVSHAFHSESMEPAREAFERHLKGVTLSPPEIPFVSNVTGTWITDGEATDPAYWARQLREPVRFGPGLATLGERPELLLLEVGPGRSLGQLARQAAEGADGAPTVRVSLPTAGEEDGLAELLLALGGVWADGVPVDWAAFEGDRHPRRLPLPTYPFERQRHWIDPGVRSEPASADSGAPPPPPPTAVAEDPPAADAPAAIEAADTGEVDLDELAAGIEQQIAEIWKELLGVDQVASDDDFFALGGDSLLGTQLITRIQETFPVEVKLQRVFEQPTLGRLAAVVRDELLETLEGMSELEAEQLV